MDWEQLFTLVESVALQQTLQAEVEENIWQTRSTFSLRMQLSILLTTVQQSMEELCMWKI